MKYSIKTTVAGLALAAGVAIAIAAPAAENWENHCARCHGADGKGQTKVGKKLNVKDYTKADVQAQMKDEEMFKVISEGVKENGKEKKKPYKDELSAEEIKALIAYIRQFKS
jgi:cytochrome c6